MMGLDEAAGSPTPWSWASSPTAVRPTPAPPTGPWCHAASPPARAYFLHDGLGSTAALVQGDGTVRNRYAYDPYGQTTTTCPTGSCVSNPFQYTGAAHDETTGLYKIGHRYYQPDHGRWTQQDPLLRAAHPTRRSQPLRLRRLQPHQLHRPKRVNFTICLLCGLGPWPFLAWPSRPYRLWEHRMPLQH
jgi:RHS repeat-associated protein